MKLQDFYRHSADWRAIIRKNTYRTYFVITSFITIYAGLGLLVDLVWNLNKYPDATVSEILYNLAHLKLPLTFTFLLSLLAIIAVMITFAWHDKLMLLGTEYFEITPQTARNAQEYQLYNVVEELKISASLPYMPKIYLIDADYMNAFASGYSEKSSMIAITRGLMTKLNRAELQAVMAHEISHIRHLDIKLTLMAAVLSNITLLVIDLLFRSLLFTNNQRERDKGRGNLYLIVMVIRFLLPLITILLIFYLSRTREYMADAGCVELMRDNQPLANALLKIANDHNENVERYNAEYQRTHHEAIRREAYIFDPKQAGIANLQSLSDLFSTHPNIKSRLAALGFKTEPF